ncbi:hypothetical protein NPIL_249001 [Nephila pilipes]|uniref:Uncharacterized protein n=1 Tax=Nephila pilipes TaxID=299642 RepID=A0A8X6N2B1_NEPPI|nr:hypothetical protein NPIL_249001 [Nephila pilipes]
MKEVKRQLNWRAIFPHRNGAVLRCSCPSGSISYSHQIFPLERKILSKLARNQTRVLQCSRRLYEHLNACHNK